MGQTNRSKATPPQGPVNLWRIAEYSHRFARDPSFRCGALLCRNSLTKPGAWMPLLLRAVAGWCARANFTPLRFAALPVCAAALVHLGACGTDPRVPTTVVLNTTTLTFTALGEEQQLSPSITDQEGTALPSETASWSSSNPAVATVTGTGLVTARGAGAAEIIVTAGSATATAHVSVVQTPVTIEKVL